MYIGEQDFEKLDRYLIAQTRAEFHQAPRSLFALVSTLVGSDDILAGYSEYASAEATTTWRTWIVTETSIAHAHITYQDEMYDSEEESRRGQYNQQLTNPRVEQAWCSALSEVTDYVVGGVSIVLPDGWFASLPSLRFRGNMEPVELPSQQNLHGADERGLSHEFHRVLRDRLFK